MSAAEAFEATTKWGAAYNKDPKNARNALGYAASLRALGNNQRAAEVLQTAYLANPNDGQLAAELGRAALETGQVGLAGKALKTAEDKGIEDWKTLSAQGTLAAKAGDHAKAQKYFQAALKKKPDSSSVINNLALSYALDGKAKQAEKLLRTAADNGHDDKRLRVWFEMKRADGAISALNEQVLLCVDQSGDKPRAAPFAPDQIARIRAFHEADAHLPMPRQAGRGISLRKTE